MAFHHWGDNADEVSSKIAQDFFDSRLASMSFSADGSISKKLSKDEKIMFPSDKMRLLKMMRFDHDNLDDMVQAKSPEMLEKIKLESGL